MQDKIMVAIAGIMCGAGGFVAGMLVRQPEINRLQNQVMTLQQDIDSLIQVAAEQNQEIEHLLVKYKSLKVFNFLKKGKLRENIQDELICQYAAADYLTLLLDSVEFGKKMSRDEIKFYRQYGSILEDNFVDDEELEVLRPLMMERHERQIKKLQRCDFAPIFKRIELYSTNVAQSPNTGFFRRKRLPA